MKLFFRHWSFNRILANTSASALPIVFAATSVVAQQHTALPRDTIAQVGSTVITARELIQRIESVPFPGNETATKADAVKERALHAMIAERLLGQEAKRLGLSQDKRSKLMFQELENLFIRDELYKREIAASAVVTEGEVSAGMKRLPNELQVLSFLVRTRADGEAFSKKLRTVKPDSVLQALRSTQYTQVDTIKIRFGSLDTAYEGAAYAIGASRISKPFYSGNFGWAVLYLLDKQKIPDAAKLNLEERLHRVEKILKERREGEIAARYYYRLLQSKHASADEKIFNLLANSIVALWKEDSVRFHRNGGYILTSDMVEIILDRLQPHLDSTLVAIDGGGLTLGEALEMLRYEDYLSKHLDGDSFKVDLNEEIKNLAAKELLAREGKKLGLLSSDAVQSDLQLWTDYIAAVALYNRLRDSVIVTDEEIIQHLIKNKESFGRQYEVNVREVLRKNAEDVNVVLEALKRGDTMADLVAAYSTRTEWLKTSGESGYFRVVEHPEIGFRALDADTGKLVGPVQLPEGFSVFTVLGKRSTKEAVTSFDTLTQNVRARILTEKRKQVLNSVIANLAREKQVRINYEKLKTVRVTLIPTFTRRYIGFGGRITAVPLLMQQWDWIKTYLSAEKLP